MIRLLGLLFGILISVQSFAQNNFRSRQSGDWNQATTWEEFVAGSWQLTATTPTSASGTITIQSGHTVTVTVGVTIDQTTVNAGGILVVNDAIALTLNNGSGNDLVNAGTLTMLGESYVDAVAAGAATMVTSGTLQVGSLNSTGAIVTGSTLGNIRLAGVRTYNSGAVITYNGTSPQFVGSGHPTTTGVITEINNSNGVTFNSSCTGNPVGSTLTIPGNLLLTSGNLNLVSTSSGRILSLGGNVTANANSITLTGSSSSITINGTGAFGTFPFPAGSVTMGNLTINRTGGTVSFSNSLTITGNLSVAGNVSFDGATTSVTSGTTTLTSGSIDFNGTTTLTSAVTISNGTTIFFEGQSLTLARNFTTTGGLLSSNASSSLALTGSTAHSSALLFSPSGNTLGTLSLTMTNVGTSASVGSALTINSALNLNDGVLSVGSNLSMGNGSTIAKNSEGSLSGTSPAGGPWNLAYSGSSQSTGIEIPASGSLSSLTLNTDNASVVTLTQNITVVGALTISSAGRTFTAGANNVAIGSLSNAGVFNAPNSSASTGLTISGTGFTNNGTFNNNSGTIIFSGAVTPGGTQIATTNFYNVTISPTGVLTSPSVLNVQGNFVNNGSFVSGTGRVAFSGTSTTLSGSTIGTTNFYDITVNPGTTLVASSNFNIQHNFVLNGSFTAGSGTITFNGSATLSGTNASTTTFNAITIAASSSLIPPTTLTMTSDFSNSGTFTAGSGTVIFSGNSTLSGSTMGTTNFNNITISPASTLVPATTLNIQGNLVNDGTLTAGSGTVVFSGNIGSKTISGASNTQFFNLTVNKTNGGTSLTLSSAQTVTNTLTLTAGILSITGSNLTLSNGASISRAAGSIATSAPAGGPWNLTYTGATKTTGLEIPASGNLLSLTNSVNNGAAVNLSQSVTVANALAIVGSGRTLTAGTNSVTAGSISNGGTFNAPTAAAATGLTISGSFANDGTFVHNSGVVNIAGSVTLSGSTIDATNFFDVVIGGTGALTPSTTLNVQGNFTNNGIFTAGSSTVAFTGNTGSRTLSGTTNTSFNNVTLNKGNAGISVTVNSAQTINGTLSLLAGQLSVASSNLAMGNGSSIIRNNNAQLVTSSPTGGPWNLTYTGTGLTTGLEAGSGSLLSLTISSNSGAVVTLNTDLVVTNGITVNAQAAGPTLSCGAHSVSAATLTNGGIFSAPTPALNLTLTGNFVNNGTFNRGTGTVVFNGTSAISGSSSATFHHVTITGTLTRPTDLFLTGNFTNNGTFSGSTGTVYFNGTTTQNLGGSTLTDFSNINVNNTVGVSVESNQNLIGVLTLGANAKIDADGSAGTSIFTLVSTDDAPAALDAQIATLPSGAAVNGSVNVQRYMQAADNFDRFISSPLTNATVAMLQDDFSVTGSFTGTSFPCTGCNNNGPSLKRYDETQTGAFSIGYTGFPGTGGSNTAQLVPGVGYDAYMWNATTAFVWDARGSVNQGTINFTVSHTASVPAVPTADGWNLVGNPYPSAIQWNEGAGWSKTNIDPTVWVWDVVGRVWHSYNSSTLVGDLTNGVIATGQGFWVYVPTPGAASMSINEQAKSSAGTGRFYRERGNAIASLKISLSNERAADNAFLIVNDQASEQFDEGWDAPKLQLGIERLSLSFIDLENHKLGHVATDKLPEIEIPLYIYSESSGAHSIRFDGVQNAEWEGYFLVDKVAQVSIPVSSGNQYDFSLDEGETDDRFYISKNPVVKSESMIRLSCYPNPASSVLKVEINASGIGELSLMDGMGRQVGSIPFETTEGRTKGELRVDAYPRGIYMVKAIVNGELIIQRVLLK